MPYVGKAVLEEISHDRGLVRPEQSATWSDVSSCSYEDVLPGLETAHPRVGRRLLPPKLEGDPDSLGAAEDDRLGEPGQATQQLP